MTLFDQNGVPHLELSDESKKKVAANHNAYLENGSTKLLYTGHVVFVDNPRPRSEDEPTITIHHIGASSLDEALKDVVGPQDTHHGAASPKWVASTSGDLANLLAEHWGCQVKKVEDV